jgi:phosphoenolpyruvate synthase/pyruvate phosphate dikinase
MHDIHTRLAHQDSCNASHDSRLNSQDSRLEAQEAQFKEVQTAQQNTNSLLDRLMGEVHKIQVNQEKLLSQPSSPPHTERTVPVSTSTPYQHPNAHFHDGTRPPSLNTHCQDPPRKDEDGCQHDQAFRWVPPRAELTKFDDNMLVDWLEDCEYYFTISHTPKFYKVQTVIHFLVGKARE